MTVDNLIAKCVMIPAEDLIPHPRNPNRHPDTQIRALCASIQRFGWRHSVIVSNLSGFVVAGHARVLAALKLGVLVPVEYQDFRDEKEEVAFLAADNRIAELAIIDQYALEQVFDFLGPLEDLSSLGYELLYKASEMTPPPPGEASCANTQPSIDNNPPRLQSLQVVVNAETEEALMELFDALLNVSGISWTQKG